MTQTTKKFGGTITDWCLHTLYPGDSDEFRQLTEEFDIQTDAAYIFTGTVKEDPLGRWEEGWSMKSSLVLHVDREAGIIETANTIYKVEDENESYTGGDIGRAAMSIYF